MIRTDWTMAEAWAIHALPFADLMHRAQTLHRAHFDPNAIETASLLSIKTGGCLRIAAIARNPPITTPG